MDYMDLALMEARLALEEGEVPVGAVILRNGEAVGKGHNQREKKLDVSSHAEIEALKDASKKLGRVDLSDCEIYVTLEPCLMCAGAIKAARIKAIHFGAYDPKEGAISGPVKAFEDNRDPHHPLVYGGEREEECSELLSAFFKTLRQDYNN